MSEQTQPQNENKSQSTEVPKPAPQPQPAKEFATRRVFVGDSADFVRDNKKQ